MASPLIRVGSFFRELKRRKVYQVTVVYVVLAVGALEILALVIPETRIPEWASSFLLAMAIVGLPLVVVFAWTFDITPGGVVRTPDANEEGRDLGEDVGGDVVAAAPVVTPGLDPTSVAVLPFENLSASAEAEPFAMGLHDDLLTELSRASAITVISRTSVRGYRGTTKSMREIGLELGAGTIVEGGVQKVGNRVRLNVQMIDAATDTHRWAERYDRELTAENIFELQTELARRIMAELHQKLTPEERARTHERPTDDLEAYRLYALGRERYIIRSADGMRDAAGLFRRALALDPDYALALVGLGLALLGLVDYGHITDPAAADEAGEALERALRIAPELPEAHAAMGAYRTYRRDAPGALAALRPATELGPGLSLGHQWTAWVELLTGDLDAALEDSKRACRLDPLEPEARGNLAFCHLAIGEPEAAREQALQALEAHPGFAWAEWVLGWAHLALGEWAAGAEVLGRSRERLFRPWGIMVRGLQAARAGEEGGARDAAGELAAMDAPFEAGLVHAALGEMDAAFQHIGEAAPLFWDDALALRYLRAWPMDEIRADARYGDAVAALDASWGLG